MSALGSLGRNATIGDIPSPITYIGDVKFPWLFSVWAIVLAVWLIVYVRSAHHWLAHALTLLVNRVLRGGSELYLTSIHFALLGGRIYFEGAALHAPPPRRGDRGGRRCHSMVGTRASSPRMGTTTLGGFHLDLVSS